MVVYPILGRLEYSTQAVQEFHDRDVLNASLRKDAHARQFREDASTAGALYFGQTCVRCFARFPACTLLQKYCPVSCGVASQELSPP